jgi:hypothetical protein
MKWLQIENETGTATLRQHCYVPQERKRPYTGEPYIGNVSLCGKSHVGNENAEIEEYDKVDAERFIFYVCCKKCFAIYNKSIWV